MQEQKYYYRSTGNGHYVRVNFTNLLKPKVGLPAKKRQPEQNSLKEVVTSTNVARL